MNKPKCRQNKIDYGKTWRSRMKSVGDSELIHKRLLAEKRRSDAKNKTNSGPMLRDRTIKRKLVHHLHHPVLVNFG
jgi:hypothetical protein